MLRTNRLYNSQEKWLIILGIGFFLGNLFKVVNNRHVEYHHLILFHVLHVHTQEMWLKNYSELKIMETKYQNLLASSVDSFYEAKSSNKEKEKLYFKGITEGMMQIIREADLLSLYDIDNIIDSAKEKYMVKADGNQKGFDPEDLDIPAYIRKGKSIST